jgi:tetratricopeptide (TPR) repeat protein
MSKSEQAARSELNQGYAALEAQQYDQAMNRADAFLQHTPAGPGSAEALYLRGRALEQKPASNQAEAVANLQAAQRTYRDALAHSPSPKLETYIRVSQGNVDYFLDDYAGAVAEWNAAYDKIDDNDVKAWVLYRIGVCRQRLDQFSEADRYFTSVQQHFPDSLPAQRAKEHIGARSFFVQFATFASAPAADDAINAFRREGVLAGKRVDAKGRSVVVTGSLPSFQQALALRNRYAGKYPDALILP